MDTRPAAASVVAGKTMARGAVGGAAPRAQLPGPPTGPGEVSPSVAGRTQLEHFYPPEELLVHDEGEPDQE